MLLILAYFTSTIGYYVLVIHGKYIRETEKIKWELTYSNRDNSIFFHDLFAISKRTFDYIIDHPKSCTVYNA